MIDLQDAKQRGRLLKAIATSREALEVFRRVRAELIRDYVGSWYSTHGARNETLVNLINQTARIYARTLAANNPRVNVTVDKPELWAFAERYKVGLNRMIQSMELDVTLRSIVLDAFFSFGVAKVCMGDSGDVDAGQDVWFDPGKPFVGRVSLDNLIIDLAASDLSRIRFCGDRYRAPWDRVRKEPSFNKAVVKQLAPTSKNSLQAGSDLANDISTGAAVDDDELEPMIWLQDVWLPGNKSVATFACDVDLPPLIERKWKGGKGGPYKFLSLGMVPDNVMPSSPASNLKGLHDKYNSLFRKGVEQAEQQKNLVAYPPGEEGEAEVARKARNGGFVKFRDPRQLVPIVFPGVDGQTAAFNINLGEIYNQMAGNPRGRAGLGAEAGTARQEEIIQGRLSEQDADMQFHVVQFAAEICYDLGYLMWSDEFMKIPAAMQIPGTQVYVDASWEPGRRQGQFNQYDFPVEPYSMVLASPKERVMDIFTVLDRLAPLWAMFERSGANLDVEEFLNTVAGYLDRPELKKIIKFLAPLEAGNAQTPRQSPVTTRRTIRENIPTGGTAQNRAGIMQQLMQGGGQVTPAQMASMGRAPA